MKKLTVLCLVMFLLVGCGKDEDKVQTNVTGDEASMDSLDDSYYKMIKMPRSELSEQFYNDFSTTNDFEVIGRDLQILSSKHFSTSSYYMSEGQHITREEKKKLLQRNQEYTLQPKAGTTIEGVLNPVMISSIQEQDFYVKDGSKYTLKALSIAIVIEPRDANNHILPTPMSDKTIKAYAKDSIKKFYDYMQNSESMEKLKDLPMLITVYQASNSEENIMSGKYIYESYCDGKLGDIKTLNHKNVLFSSQEAEEVDMATYSEFNEIKNNLKKASTEAIGLVGEAKYIDNEIQSMVIEAHLNVKTYTELLYLTSLLADNIDSKFSNSFDVKTLIYSQDGLKAIIVKNKGESAQTNILY